VFWNDYWWIVLVGILVLPLLGVLGFGYWLRRRNDISLELSVKCWETFIKLISAFTVIVSGAMLFGKYIDQQGVLESGRLKEIAREQSLREAEFLRQKLNFDTEQHNRSRALLGEAKNLAARLASMETPDKKSMIRIEELYYADLIGVEKLHGDVERAMVRYRNKLSRLPDAPNGSLYDLSLELSKAVETELKESKQAILLQHRVIAELLSPKPQ
jgi:hypothetical protein